MKKTIYILLTILLSLTLIGAKAQETPPSGLKSVNAQFYISLADSSIWQNKGVPYGWQRVARYKDIKKLKDTLNNFPLKSGVILNQEDILQNAKFAINGNGELATLYADVSVNTLDLTVNGQANISTSATINATTYNLNINGGVIKDIGAPPIISPQTYLVGFGADNQTYSKVPVSAFLTAGSNSNIHNQDTTTQTANFKISGTAQSGTVLAGDLDAGVYGLLTDAGVESGSSSGSALLSVGGVQSIRNDAGMGYPYAEFSILNENLKTIATSTTAEGVATPFEFNWLQSLKTPTVDNDVVRLQDLSSTTTPTSLANRDTVLKYYASSIFKPVLLDSTLTLDVYGNSFEVGADVSTNEAWRYIFKNTFGFPTLIPNASGGTGILYAQRRQMINSPQTNNNRFKTLNLWFNQIGQQGRGVKTLNMGIYGLRAFIANSLLATAVPASDVSVTKTGTWTTYTGSDSSAMKATYIGGTSQQSFTAGATITATITGNNLVIGTGITDGSHLIVDSLTAVVDGTYTKKFNGNGLINYAPQLASGVPTNTFLNYYHQATVIVFDNLGPGSHTVVITKGGNSSARIVIDYIGTMMSPSTATPLIIGECPYFTPTGISTYNGLYGTQFTNGTVDTANVATIGVVKEFEAYPITIAKVNTHLDLVNGLVADKIHPNPIGQRQIFNAYSQATVPFNKSLSKYTNTPGYITNTPTGTGANYYGTLNINKDVSQGTGTSRYLILTKVSLGGSLVGNIIGKRTKASSAGTNSANIYVNIRQNATTSTAYWESDAGTNATQPVLVTVTYDDGTGADTWYAIDAITTSSSSSLEKALFIGQAETTGVPFTWVAAGSVTPIGTFQSNTNKNFGGRFNIGTTGVVSVNNLTTSGTVQTSAAGVLTSIANNGTGTNVLTTSPALVTPSLGVATATSINKVTITAPTTSATLTLVTGSSLITAGAFATTLTATGTTNITLPTTGTLQTLNGVETVTNKTLTTPKLTGYTVATLPAGTVGMMAYVTDALTPTFLVAVVGGGAVVTPVFYNGSAWVSY